MSAKNKHRPRLIRVGTWLGIAGLLGVAAGGVLVTRNERQRRAYTPEEVRQRLHERAGQARTVGCCSTWKTAPRGSSAVASRP